MTPTPLDVDTEFASVRIALHETANGPRLEVSDRRTGMKRYLDPLVIEGLAHAADEDLVALVDPSKRWLLEAPPP
jgi:hypothetical protein